MKAARYCVIAIALLGYGVPLTAFASGNDCSDDPGKSQYSPAPGDTMERTHFAAVRSFEGQGRLELNVCAGELHVNRSKDGALHVQVTLQDAPANAMRTYVHVLNVDGDHATVSLDFPRKYHPSITISYPSSATLTSELNLGAGALTFDANRIAGDRKINVGAGNATLMLAQTKDYAHLQANVGMGSFHDNRPASRSSGHLVVSREMSGTGAGQLEVNVGAGSIDLQPAED